MLPLHPAHHSSSSSGSGGGGGTSDYYGCLDLNTTEQEETWPDGPTCDYAVDTEGNSTVTEYEVVDDDISSNPYGDFVISEVSLLSANPLRSIQFLTLCLLPKLTVQHIRKFVEMGSSHVMRK